MVRALVDEGAVMRTEGGYVVSEETGLSRARVTTVPVTSVT
jgi:hypothetical protein